MLMRILDSIHLTMVETDEEKIAENSQPIFQIYSSRIFMEIVILKVKYKRDDNWFSHE